MTKNDVSSGFGGVGVQEQTLCKEGMKQCAPLRWVGLWPFPKRMAVSKNKKGRAE